MQKTGSPCCVHRSIIPHSASSEALSDGPRDVPRSAMYPAWSRQTDRQTGEQHNDRCPLGRPRVNHDLTTAPSQPSHWLHHSLQSTWAAGRCLAAKWPGITTTDTGNRSSVRRDRLVKQRRLETGDALCRLLVSSTTLSVARYALFVPFFACCSLSLDSETDCSSRHYDCSS